MKNISEDQFYEDFTLVTNHLDANASFGGCMFETYGDEVLHVENTDSEKVWTVIECEGAMYLLSGLHYVNRLGYLITEESYDEEIEVEV